MFNPIRFETDLLMKCLNCRNRFWIDGDLPIGSCPCTKCGSVNIDNVHQGDLPEQTFDLVDEELKDLQRKLKNKKDRTSKDIIKFGTLLDHWNQRKNKK
ncbi:MAG: hypothetical protein V4721_16440 [Bacteroidota bacterium]